MITVAHIDQLSGHAQLVAGFAHASFQNRAHVQLIADFTKDVLFVFALERKQDVRPGTRNPGTLESTLINSSVIPSLKYSSFLSALMFTNGSTAIDLLGAAVGASLSRGVVVDLCSTR